jgi:hypothetical protein
MKVKLLTFSAWSELIPTLFCIFSIARPRRFVELGTHNGMSFFAACQATEALALDTQCIAVDNWIGDPHASFHSDEVFDQFRANIKSNFPDQFYIKSQFKHALECFEDASIDLLHIDGYHTYAAVKDDFETWLPKMSQCGVILFHDINVHEREFGVWRLWHELKDEYPSFSVPHCHGLGIICVGRQPSTFGEILQLLRAHPGYEDLVRAYLETVGQFSIESRRTLASLQDALAGKQPRAEVGSRDAQIAELQEQITEMQRFQHAVLNSTSWRVTQPLRFVKTVLTR